jgi:hypothetical protein
MLQLINPAAGVLPPASCRDPAMTFCYPSGPPPQASENGPRGVIVMASGTVPGGIPKRR